MMRDVNVIVRDDIILNDFQLLCMYSSYFKCLWSGCSRTLKNFNTDISLPVSLDLGHSPRGFPGS